MRQQCPRGRFSLPSPRVSPPHWWAGSTVGPLRRTPKRSLLREPAGPAFAFRGRWPIDMMRLPAAWEISTGLPRRARYVAVVDTGVRVTPDLFGRVVLSQRDVESEGRYGDQTRIGRGTKVAGIVAASGLDGAGSGGRVLDDAGFVSIQASTKVRPSPSESVAADRRPGSRTHGSPSSISVSALSSTASLEREAIGRAIASGIVVVAAAGNDGFAGVPEFPAAYAGVLAVGAVGPGGKRAAFSNRGPWVGVMAPGCGAALDLQDRPCRQRVLRHVSRCRVRSPAWPG